MKIYTQTYDLAKASPHRFWVAPFSEFKIGIKILEKDEISAKDFTLKAGSIEFTPDADKIDNFTLYTIKSNDTGFVDYTIEVEGVAEKLKLMQIVTDSTVFEIDAGGGGDVPADVATQTWVNSQISDFITDDALDGYATESYVDSATSSFVEEGELTAYATKAELTAYAETSDLTAYAEKADLTAYATKDELTAYAETSDIKDSTITFTQGGVTKGSFTLNQATSATIALDAGGGDMSNYYTKSETDGLLSTKADAVKKLPADVTVWVTTGWNDATGEDEQGTPWTKIQSGFYDVSDYGDVEVSAQYVSPGWVTHPTPVWAARGRMNLFSECSNGKTLGVTLWDRSDGDWFFDDASTWESNIDGYISAYYEFDPTQVPEGSSNLLEYVPISGVKLFAYVSRNMDQSAPYDLREITDEADRLGQPCQPEDIWHDAYDEVIPGFVEVSAVYDNQISSKVDQQYLQDNYLNSDDTQQAIDDQVAYALEDYYPKTETSSATEIGTALAGKQPTGNYLTAETDPTFNTWLSGESFGIGEGAQVGSRAIAIGYYGKALGQYSVAIGGPNCNALANSAIQLGDGTNMTDGMFQVFSYPMLSSDGKIPNERLHLSAVSESDWATLSGSADAGTFYFVY